MTHPSRLARTALAAAGALAAVLPAAACSASLSAGAPAAPAAAVKAAAPAVPDTAAAARSAVQRFFALYSAGQWDAAWQYLAPASRKTAPEKLYAAFHAACPQASAGMAYQVKDVTMAGNTAVITYTIPAVEKIMGSATTAMAWTSGGWKTELDAASTALYSHGGLAGDLKAAKAAGYCSGS
jgi:hypothetical protein